MNCKKCGEILSENAKFCNNCGEAVVKNASTAAKRIKCPSCGAFVDSNHDYCQRCNAPIKSKSVANETFKLVAENSRNIDENLVIEKQQCPDCHAVISIRRNVCPRCGRIIKAIPSIFDKDQFLTGVFMSILLGGLIGLLVLLFMYPSASKARATAVDGWIKGTIGLIVAVIVIVLFAVVIPACNAAALNH